MFRRVSTIIAMLAVLLPAAAGGQTGNSTISGVVEDTTGGALPGATISITNEDTNVSVDSRLAHAVLPGSRRHLAGC